MKRNGLIAKPIIDKNGKATTVHVLPGSKSASRTEKVQVRRAEKTHDLVIPASPPATADWWNRKPLEHVEITTPTGGLFVLAPEGYSGAYCDECGSFFTDARVDTTAQCGVCFRTMRGGKMPSGVRYAEAVLFDDDVARDTDWYHVTMSKDWDNDIRKESASHQPYVHVGSIEAAMHRMKNIVQESRSKRIQKISPEFYCYRVKLTPEAALSPHILPDFDNGAPVSPYETRETMRSNPEDYEEFYGSYELYGATRYVNEFESHGSISLLAHPSSFEVLERTAINTKD